MTASLIRRNEVETGFAPVEYNFTGFREIANAMFEHQADNLNFMSQTNLLNDVRSQSAKRFEELSGLSVGSMIDPNLGLAAEYHKLDKTIEQKRNEGLDGWNEVYTSYEIENKAIERAQASKMKYDEAFMRAAPDASPTLATLAGGMAGWFADPAQTAAALLTAPLTVPRTGIAAADATLAARAAWVGRAAGAEAVVSGALEVPAQVAVKDWQDIVGHEYTWGDAALNVGFAAVGAGAISAIGTTASRAWRYYPPRVGDATTNQAIVDNMSKVLETAARTGKMPDPIQLDPRGLARKYEGPLSKDELDVVRGFLGEEKGTVSLETYGRKAFIAAKIEEYKLDAKLVRGDLKKLQTEYLAVRDTIEPKKAEIDAKKAQLAEMEKTGDAVIKQFGENSPEAKLMQEEYKKLYQSVLGSEKTLVKNLNRASGLKQKINSTLLAEAAERHLKDLNSYKIPKHLEKKYTKFKHKVKEALEIQKAYENQVRDYADMLLETPRITELDEAQTLAKMPEHAKAVENEFNSNVKDILTGDKPDEAIVFEGRKVKVTELNDEIKAEKSFAQRIMSCAFGGAK